MKIQISTSNTAREERIIRTLVKHRTDTSPGDILEVFFKPAELALVPPALKNGLTTMAATLISLVNASA